MARNKRGKWVPHRVLITRFSALGDVAMSVPAIYSVCAAYPDTEFMLLTKGIATSLFVERPQNLKVKGVDLKQYKGVGGLWRLMREIRSEFDFDAYADLHDVLRTKILRAFAVAAGKHVRHIHKGRRGKRALTRRHNKVLLPMMTNRARYRDVFRRLGMDFEITFDGYYRSSPASDKLFEAVSALKQPGETWIGIAPFAAHRGKIYPLDKTEKIAAEFAARENTKVFLFGAGKHEDNILGQWAMRYDNMANMAQHRLGLEAELALLSNCDVVLSMDSANMHLASLVGTPVVSIWGATHPYCGFYGWRQDPANAVGLDLTCRPCSVFGDKPCMRGDYFCMHGIRPERVTEAMDRACKPKHSDSAQ